MLLPPEEKLRLSLLPRDEQGLRPQDPVEVVARDTVLWHCSRLRRDGIVVALPPIARRTR